MDHSPTPDGPEEPQHASSGPFSWWTRTPLYLRILAGMVLGVIVGVAAGKQAGSLELPAKLILRMLGALAPPLILVAVMQALMTVELRGRSTGRLIGLLIMNTVVAIGIGLLVANVLQPGRHAKLTPHTEAAPAQPATPEEQRILDLLKARGFKAVPEEKPKDAFVAFLDNIPDSLLRPLVENNKVIGVIFIAVAFGIALRAHRRRRVENVQDLLAVAFACLLTVLHWVIQLVPLGVFGIVASIVGRSGFEPFKGLAAFIGAVLLALVLQATYYLTRVAVGSWVTPARLLKGCRDALVLAFSTASSTFSMPLNYECLRYRVGLREQSASMGALVGSNFNNDGTALYEAMSALFVAQMLGMALPIEAQLMLVLTSIAASVGAAGIPEAGLVTMTLVFTAAGLPTDYIALLLTVDWFLDRCRTTINLMGDMNVACMLDGRKPPTEDELAADPTPPAPHP